MIKEKTDFFYRIENEDYQEYCLLMENSGYEPSSYQEWLSIMDVKADPPKQSDTPTFDAIHNFNFDNIALPELLYRTYISLSSFPDPNSYDVKLRRRLEQELKDMANTEDLTIDAFTGMSSSIKDLRKELTAAEEQIFKLTTEVEQLTAERDRAIHFKREAEKQTAKTEEHYLNAKAEYEDIKRSYNELQQSREQLVVTVKSLTEDLENDRNAWDHKTNVLRSENEELREKVHNWNVLYADDDQYRGLRHEIGRFQQENKSLKEQVLALNDHIAAMEENELERIEKELDSEDGQRPTDRKTPANAVKYPHYFVEVPNVTHVDISWVLRAFSVPCCEGHAIKKLLAAGKRGAKDKLQDLKEARDSISRAIEMEDQQ